MLGYRGVGASRSSNAKRWPRLWLRNFSRKIRYRLSGWGLNSPPNSFRFCRAKLVIGCPFARLARRHVAEFRVRLFSIDRPARLIVRKNAFQHGSRTCLTVYWPIGFFAPAWKSIVRRLPRGRFVGSASEIRVQLPERVDHRVKLRRKVPLD